jgi:hypothetical protein
MYIEIPITMIKAVVDKGIYIAVGDMIIKAEYNKDDRFHDIKNTNSNLTGSAKLVIDIDKRNHESNVTAPHLEVGIKKNNNIRWLVDVQFDIDPGELMEIML